MISVLAKLLIPEYKEFKTPRVRQAYGVLCGCVGIFFNFCLFVLKFLAGYLSHSISITADAFNNLSDAGSSVITLIGFRLSAQEPDPDHPFGHGRMEYLAGLAVAGLILVMAFSLLRDSVDRILHPAGLEWSLLICFILIVSILIKLYMYCYNKKISQQIDSPAMAATAADSISDCLSTAVVLGASLLQHYAHITIDGWCGIAVACIIFKAAFEAAKETINPLLGQPPEPEFVRQIEELVLSFPQVLGIHDLVVHNYGPGRVMISLHAEVPASGNILELHDTIDNIERKLSHDLHCSAVIHMDPVVNDDPLVNELKEEVLHILSELDDTQLSLHDFRMVTGPTHCNLIFDVLVPYQYRLSDAEICRHLQTEVHKKHSDYFCVITVDKKYTA